MSKLIKNKLAIFDIDGTLTDSIDIHQAAFRGALELVGVTEYDGNWSNYKHHTDSYIFSAIYELTQKQTADSELIKAFEGHLYTLIASASLQQPVKEIQGAAKMLDHLVQNSPYHIVFATGSFHRAALLKLKQSGVYHLEELVIASDEIHSRDELVSQAVETAKAFYSIDDFDRIISFGDGYWDYKTACNLEIDFIGIGNTKLLEHGAVHVFPHFEDEGLMQIL